MQKQGNKSHNIDTHYMKTPPEKKENETLNCRRLALVNRQHKKALQVWQLEKSRQKKQLKAQKKKKTNSYKMPNECK